MVRGWVDHLEAEEVVVKDSATVDSLAYVVNAELSSKARIGETRKIDLPSLPLDSSFQHPPKSEAFWQFREKTGAFATLCMSF